MNTPQTDRTIRAPWTPEQVAALNAFQYEGGMHPFTCGHEHPAHPNAILEATPAGWRCFVLDCEYTQDWAHAFMADPGAWPAWPFGERHGPTPEEMRAAAAARVVSPHARTVDEERRNRYAQAIHDAMEPDLSLVDQEPGCQALFARAAEEATALADVEQATIRAAVYRELADRQTQLAVADDLQRRSDLAAARRQLVKELRRMADEEQQPEWARPETEEEKLAKARRMAKALSAPPVAPPEWATTTDWPNRHKRPGDRRVHATAPFQSGGTRQFWTACGKRITKGGFPMSHMPVDCRDCKRVITAVEGQPTTNTPEAPLPSLRGAAELEEKLDIVARPHCPRCREDLTGYGEDDFVYLTGDARPYCSGECVVATHRAALKTQPAAVAEPGKET